jgi:prepilin-type N-terminal cleavage/methylation domain-containing protein
VETRRRNQRTRAGFSLLELLAAVTITALLSTAVVASFQMGLSSWRRGEDFWDRSQRYAAAIDLLQKQIGSITPMWPVSALNLFGSSPNAVPVSAPDLPLFAGTAREMFFVTDLSMPGATRGGLQLVHYSIHTPDEFNATGPSASSARLPNPGLIFCVSSAPLFRRDDFATLARTTAAVTAATLPLFESVEDVAFRYWGEAEASGGAAAPAPKRLVPFEEWDVTKHRQLPEAVSIQIRFAKPTPQAKAAYLRDTLDLLIPVNVSKND